jgi:hypothetical protein
MSNALYNKARQAFLEGGLAWLTDDIRVILVDNALYTFNQSTHEFLSDIPAGARVAVSTSLTGKTSTDGVADATDLNPTFTAVSGAQSEAVVLYKHTGVEGTSRLIAYIDTATGLPVTPNGGDILVVWDNGANKIFKL